MTKEEAISKYGDVPLKFSSYYKYSFRFSGVAEDGAAISISVGGDSDDIYKFEVNSETVLKLKDEDYRYASIDKDGKEVWEDSNRW